MTTQFMIELQKESIEANIKLLESNQQLMALFQTQQEILEEMSLELAVIEKQQTNQEHH